MVEIKTFKKWLRNIINFIFFMIFLSVKNVHLIISLKTVIDKLIKATRN